MMSKLQLVALVVASALAPANSATLSSRANPIRKVVTLLQKMEEKVTEEGKAAEETYDKFMCYCQGGTDNLQKSIDAAEEKIPSLQSSIQETTASHLQLSAEVKQHKADREAAKEAAATAASLREKEAKAFAEESTTLKANIKALGTAIDAITKGMGGFLQTNAATVLRKLTVSMDMSSDDRDLIVSFLSGTNDQGYAPQGGEINGILKQMKDEMESNLADITSDEETAVANFESLSSAKAKEIAAATKSIEDKSVRVGNAAVELATLNNDLEDTSEQLASDQAFVKDLETSCKTKTAEWDVYKKTQSEELMALADTIKLLNDDDALELFKKTLPSPSASFLQLPVSAMELRQQAKAALRAGGGSHDRRLDLLEMALHGQSQGFEAVIQKCDELVGLLAKEQEDDDAKKKYCLEQIDQVEDEKKVEERAVADRKTVIDEDVEAMSAVDSEIAALKDGIATLDSEVAEQTELRKKQHAETVETLASNNAAKELIELAKNRLAKFYNPSLYKAPAKRALSDEDQIVVNLGGTAPPTPAPGGIANTGIMSFMQVKAKQAPEADLSYAKKTEESGGVVAMMDLLREDLNKQNTELETEEKDAQADYEGYMKDSAEKRKTDAGTLADKQGAKAELEVKLQKEHEALRSEKTNVQDTINEEKAIHQECDWLLSNYDLRKEARAGEVDALQKAKAVLSGADYSE